MLNFIKESEFVNFIYVIMYNNFLRSTFFFVLESDAESVTASPMKMIRKERLQEIYPTKKKIILKSSQPDADGML